MSTRLTIMPWPFEGRPLIKAEFVARPNRFIGEFRFLGHSEIHRAHIADPGRLKELLFPGATVYVVDYRDHPTRKLPFAMPVVETKEGRLVSIYSRLPNAVFQHFFNTHPECFENLSEHRYVRTEVPWVHPDDAQAKSRFDFLLTSPQGVDTYVEVKGASLVEEGVCYFPDALTSRGARQLKHLAHIAQQGLQAWVVFIVQRDDADLFRPNWERDPVFAQALCHAIDAGVQVVALSVTLTPAGIELADLVSVDITPY